MASGGYSIAGFDPNIDNFKGRNSATDTSDKLLKSAPGAGKKINVAWVVIYNEHASSGTGVYLKSGSTIISGPFPAPANTGKGGAFCPLPTPIDCNDNEALNFSTIDAVTTIYVSVGGFISKT